MAVLLFGQPLIAGWFDQAEVLRVVFAVTIREVRAFDKLILTCAPIVSLEKQGWVSSTVYNTLIMFGLIYSKMGIRKNNVPDNTEVNIFLGPRVFP